MIEIGCPARYTNPYIDEVRFAQKNGFRFLQIWYDRNGLLFKDVEEQARIIRQCGYPAIIHAVLDINEFEEHVPKLVKILDYLGHREIIIHPVCKSERISKDTIHKLTGRVKSALDMFTKEGITLYLENNSKLDPIFTAAEEIRVMFDQNPTLEFLLDIAHIDNYNHLKELVGIRKPKILHVADRHLEVVHEHLPLGRGNIDYGFIFNEVLCNYDGRIILEIVQSDEDIINSRKIIEGCILRKGTQEYHKLIGSVQKL